MNNLNINEIREQAQEFAEYFNCPEEIIDPVVHLVKVVAEEGLAHYNPSTSPRENPQSIDCSPLNDSRGKLMDFSFIENYFQKTESRKDKGCPSEKLSLAEQAVEKTVRVAKDVQTAGERFLGIDLQKHTQQLAESAGEALLNVVGLPTKMVLQASGKLVLDSANRIYTGIEYKKTVPNDFTVISEDVEDDNEEGAILITNHQIESGGSIPNN